MKRSLFPCGDLMVCIIDDREDVWNYARNLICVQPYTYFRHTGDINDPKQLIRQQQSTSRKRKLDEITVTNTTTTTKPAEGTTLPSEEKPNNGSNDGNGNGASNSGTDGEEKTDSTVCTSSVSAAQIPILDDANDPDDYLIHLERILRTVHDEYYRIYEKRISGNKQQQQPLIAGVKRVNYINESDLPDMKKILPMIKSRVLDGCVITFSGVVPTG